MKFSGEIIIQNFSSSKTYSNQVPVKPKIISNQKLMNNSNINKVNSYQNSNVSSKVDKTRGNIEKLTMTLGRQLEGFRNRTLFSRAYSYPKGIEIDGQERKEKIILIFRSHPVTLIPKILNSIFLILLAIFVIVLSVGIGGTFKSAIVSTIILLFLISMSNILYTVVYWFYNVNIITTERIIDVDFNGISAYKISEAQIEKIEDVSVTNLGFWSSMFNFGTINIQTAAEKREFEFTNVSYPSKIQDILRDLMEIKQRGYTL